MSLVACEESEQRAEKRSLISDQRTVWLRVLLFSFYSFLLVCFSFLSLLGLSLSIIFSFFHIGVFILFCFWVLIIFVSLNCIFFFLSVRHPFSLQPFFSPSLFLSPFFPSVIIPSLSLSYLFLSLSIYGFIFFYHLVNSSFIFI